jgi:hypothetical protein
MLVSKTGLVGIATEPGHEGLQQITVAALIIEPLGPVFVGGIPGNRSAIDRSFPKNDSPKWFRI